MILTARARSIHELQALIRERGFDRALPAPECLRHPPITVGIDSLESRLGGGLPRGAVSEVTGPCSSGRTGLVLSAIASATRAGDLAVYVDATDCLDPRSAEQAGVVLERLLWVRCGKACCAPTNDAWLAASLVASAGGFGIVAVDLGGLSTGQLSAWQRKPWMRLKKTVENTPAALVVLAEKHVAGSAADVVLELSRESADWDGLLDRVAIRAEILKARSVVTGRGKRGER